MPRRIKIELPSRSFASKTEAREFFQRMLHSYAPGETVSDADAVDLEGLLLRHPDADSKIGEGIDHFEVMEAEFRSQCFMIVRTDGSFDDFSLHTCLDPS